VESPNQSQRPPKRLPCLLYQADFLYVGRMGTPYPCFESPIPSRNAYAFGFVESGHLWLTTLGNARSVVAQGHYYVLPPEQSYAPQLDGAPKTLLLTLPQSRVDAVREELGRADTPLSLGATIQGTDLRTRQIVDAIAEEATSPAPGTRLMLQSLSLQLLVHILRDQQSGPAEAGEHLDGHALSPEIRRSIDFIHAHYGDDISLDQLAAVARMSRYHYLRVFKRETGRTPHSYLRHVLLEQAALLLRTADASISEIALRLGFASPGHFSDAFKRRYGVTPSEFRSGEQRNRL
jgi:AraC-like DNA-binding protein